MNHCAEVEAFYCSRAWRKCREMALQKYGGLCQICKEKGLIEPAVHVHHRIRLTADNVNDPKISLNSANLMALCEECHKKEHRKTKRWRVDEDGNVTATAPLD